MVLQAARPDWTLIFCESGADALAKAHPDLTDVDGMLLDLNMPGMDGLELAGKLRTLYPEATLAILTANIRRRVRERAETEGCLGCSHEPIGGCVTPAVPILGLKGRIGLVMLLGSMGSLIALLLGRRVTD